MYIYIYIHVSKRLYLHNGCFCIYIFEIDSDAYAEEHKYELDVLSTYISVYKPYIIIYNNNGIIFPEGKNNTTSLPSHGLTNLSEPSVATGLLLHGSTMTNRG